MVQFVLIFWVSGVGDVGSYEGPPLPPPSYFCVEKCPLIFSLIGFQIEWCCIIIEGNDFFCFFLYDVSALWNCQLHVLIIVLCENRKCCWFSRFDLEKRSDLYLLYFHCFVMFEDIKLCVGLAGLTYLDVAFELGKIYKITSYWLA